MTASETRREIKQCYNLVKRLQTKYVYEGIRYKTIGASREAIQANAEKQELIKETLQALAQAEEKYLLKSAKEKGKRKYYHFHIV